MLMSKTDTAYQCVAVAFHGTEWLNYPYCMATVLSVDWKKETVTIEWWERTKLGDQRTNKQMKEWIQNEHKLKTTIKVNALVDYSKCMHHPHRLPLDTITAKWV